MSQIFLGLVGPIASGKGTIANYLREKNFQVYSLSDVVREEAARRGLPIEREVLQNVGDDLREKFGGQVLAERMLEKINDVSKNLVFDSIRNPSEITYLRSILNIKITGIDAPVDKRIIWYLERAKQRGEDNPDMSVFIKSSLRDRGVGQSSTGQQVDKCLQLADYSIYNSGTKQELLAEIDFFLKELQLDPEIHRSHKEK